MKLIRKLLEVEIPTKGIPLTIQVINYTLQEVRWKERQAVKPKPEQKLRFAKRTYRKVAPSKKDEGDVQILRKPYETKIHADEVDTFHTVIPHDLIKSVIDTIVKTDDNESMFWINRAGNKEDNTYEFQVGVLADLIPALDKQFDVFAKKVVKAENVTNYDDRDSPEGNVLHDAFHVLTNYMKERRADIQAAWIENHTPHMQQTRKAGLLRNKIIRHLRATGDYTELNKIAKILKI
jgi:hypothetical protein